MRIPDVKLNFIFVHSSIELKMTSQGTTVSSIHWLPSREHAQVVSPFQE
jgi:hypothetical protein